jgi:hypothetical protein
MLADIAWIDDSVGQYDEFRTNVKIRRQPMRCRKHDSRSFPAVIAIKSGTTNRSGSWKHRAISWKICSDITARTWHCFDRGEECVFALPVTSSARVAFVGTGTAPHERDEYRDAPAICVVGLRTKLDPQKLLLAPSSARTVASTAAVANCAMTSPV